MCVSVAPIPADLCENSTYRRGLRGRLRTAIPGVWWGLQVRSGWGGPRDTLRRGQVGPGAWLHARTDRDGPDNCLTLENTEEENAVLVQLPPLVESKVFLRDLL